MDDRVYLDVRYSYTERAADLVSRMTLAEKVAQLRTNSAPALPALGLQQYTYWNEGQHGINRLGANGSKAFSVVAFTLPGKPLIYNGQEIPAPDKKPDQEPKPH